MPLISIIIPVFNNGTKDIKKCIDSLHDVQHTDKFEVIIIDDGSSAECANFLDVLSSGYSEVKVFHQPNKGVSNARNTGVKFASGKYVAFVDADDIVTKNFISDAIVAIENSEGELDIIYGLVKYIESKGNIHLTGDVYLQDYKAKCIILSEKEKESLSCHFFDLSRAEFYLNDYYVSRGPVARLIRKELAEKYKFEETLSMGEDAVWNLELLKFAKVVGIVKRLWYYYIRNSASATQTFSDKSVEQYGNMILKLAEYANDDVRKACLLNKTISSSVEIAKGYFLTSNFSGSFLQAVKEFNQIFCTSPWNLVLKFEYALKVGWKCVIKYLLIKTGMFLIALKFKSLVK